MNLSEFFKHINNNTSTGMLEKIERGKTIVHWSLLQTGISTN
jgi:hypothetical protein